LLSSSAIFAKSSTPRTWGCAAAMAIYSPKACIADAINPDLTAWARAHLSLPHTKQSPNPIFRGLER
jgi:hypothetical protein